MSERAARELDLLDPELHASGAADRELDELRARCPVAWRAGRRGPGYWAITGHAELVAVARDPVTFTSHLGTRPEARRTPDAPRPLHNLDPPAHTRLRALANPLVSVARTPAMGAVIARAIDEFIAAGGGDAIPALAIAVPAEIFAAWLGLSDAALLAARVDAVHTAGAALLDAAPPTPAQREVARDATTALSSMLRAVITAATAPRASVLGELHALVARDAMSPLEATMLAALLVEAGLPTVSDAIAGGLARCCTRPDDIARAVEDILRACSPIQQFARYATRDTILGGVDIRAGQQVVLWYGAANRDPAVVAGDAAHVAFGAGPHRCLGARFARALLREFFTAWFARVPHHTAHGVRRASSYMRGYRELVIRFA